MLMAADLRTSKTDDDVQCYSNITFFIFAVFDVRRFAAVNMCINYKL